MARSAITDFLQDYPFWLMDVAPIETLGLPIFTPLFGFSRITSPEIVAEFDTINEGNWFFSKKVLRRASVSPMTLARGVSWPDSDFWRWILFGLTGDPNEVRFPAVIGAQIGGVTPRRTMILIHFMSRSPFSPSATRAISATAVGAAALAVGITEGAVTGAIGAGAANAALFATEGFGPFEVAARVPAKAYVLKGCIPTRYKVGSDFDAQSSQVSIAELDMQVEHLEEISLTG